MSTSIIGRIDEMGNRIDDLEKSIADLMQQVLLEINSIVNIFCVLMVLYTILLSTHSSFYSIAE
jgi:hypothetical protein